MINDVSASESLLVTSGSVGGYLVALDHNMGFLMYLD